MTKVIKMERPTQVAALLFTTIGGGYLVLRAVSISTGSIQIDTGNPNLFVGLLVLAFYIGLQVTSIKTDDTSNRTFLYALSALCLSVGIGCLAVLQYVAYAPAALGLATMCALGTAAALYFVRDVDGEVAG